jgi:hypothetical protein
VSRPEGRAAWEGSTRRQRLPPNWDSEIRPAVFALYGDVCHMCGQLGADEVDHVEQGDDHRLENLRPIHGWRTPQRCHVYKSSREGAAARPRLHRPPEVHPGLA